MQLLREDTPAQLAAQIWRNLVRSTKDSKHPWRYPVLATLHQGLPRQRTIVLRRANADARELVAYTDFRSHKVKDLRLDSSASWLFYHPKHRVQLVCTTQVSLFHQNNVSQAAWADLSVYQQRDYNTVAGPGALLSGDHPWKPEEAWSADYFTVLVAKVIRMELVVLDIDGPWRMQFTDESAGWKGERLVP